MLLNEAILRNALQEVESKTSLLESYSGVPSEFEQYDLFISHSYRDKDHIIALRHFFKRAGFSVYIDWIDDPTLDRTNVTSATAELIKKRLEQCRGLAYIDSYNIPTSKWCPWELGIADGLLGKVCILPITQYDTFEYREREYLGLYPYLEMGRDNRQLCISPQSNSSLTNLLNSYKPLRTWLYGEDWEGGRM